MKHIVPLPSLEVLNAFLTYDPGTGILSWKAGLPYAKQRQAGSPAGTMSKGGYLRTSVARRMYANNRIAWKMHYGVDPIGVVDHENGNKLDNRIANLRDAGQRENVYNSVRRSDNTTGYKGVVYSTWRRCFIINLKVGGVRVRSPRFLTPEAANDYVSLLREDLHGDFACHGERAA